MGQTFFTFDFDPKVYRLTAIKKAAYRFSAHFDVKIDQNSAGIVRVELHRRASSTGINHDATRFPNEVLDQELREIVADETKSIRDVLLAQAFSGLAIVDPVGENGDHQLDPLDIKKTSHEQRSE